MIGGHARILNGERPVFYIPRAGPSFDIGSLTEQTRLHLIQNPPQPLKPRGDKRGGDAESLAFPARNRPDHRPPGGARNLRVQDRVMGRRRAAFTRLKILSIGRTRSPSPLSSGEIRRILAWPGTADIDSLRLRGNRGIFFLFPGALRRRQDRAEVFYQRGVFHPDEFNHRRQVELRVGRALSGKRDRPGFEEDTFRKPGSYPEPREYDFLKGPDNLCRIHPVPELPKDGRIQPVEWFIARTDSSFSAPEAFHAFCGKLAGTGRNARSGGHGPGLSFADPDRLRRTNPQAVRATLAATLIQRQEEVRLAGVFIFRSFYPRSGGL